MAITFGKVRKATILGIKRASENFDFRNLLNINITIFFTFRYMIPIEHTARFVKMICHAIKSRISSENPDHCEPA